MPKTLTGNSSLFPSQTCPVAGEPRTAGSVETSFKNAADRSQYLYDRLTFVDPTREGARRLRAFASIAELKLTTDLPNGSVALVHGVGLYEYDSATMAAELSPIVVKPTVVGVGAGAWFVSGIGRGMLDVPNGVPQLDGAAKITTSRLAAGDSSGRIMANAVRNGIITVTTAFAQEEYTSSTTYDDIPGLSAGFNVLSGDRVIIVGQGSQFNDENASSAHGTIWNVTLPSASSLNIANTERIRFDPNGSTGAMSIGLSIGFSYVASSDGLHTFKMRHKTSDGWSVGVKNVFVTAIQVRP